ncbi:beta-propeller fold lactonase family protein [Mesorhizobium tamadayense]|uniref:beta-propeller fold lactonase family protein n=1 Tax=Mesorhizobium tamadayense TaxID=425306 RepID=UPI001FE04B37|nr:beta-propeller fold lactonase family protein [Mesorhizobium tamadayense]
MSEALGAIGRTEDLRFSPDNRLLAVAGYSHRRCLILKLDIEPGVPRIAISGFMELKSESMGEVHGLDFIDNRTFVVANRDGLIAVFALPQGEPAGQCREIAPLRLIKGSRFCKLRSPGSVAVKREPHGRFSLLVCNNYKHRVTRHVVHRRLRYRALWNQVMLEQGLNIPDGIALSHDGRWVAVSSHGTNDVKIYDMSAPLGRGTQSAGALENANYPHGLRFTQDGGHILVADAGSPMVHVYASNGDWRGRRAPFRSVAVLDEETFLRGRANVEEGGPKGLDIDRSNSIVAVTCQEQTLAFYGLSSIVGRRAAEPECSVP